MILQFDELPRFSCGLSFDDSFVRALPADEEWQSFTRQVDEAAFSWVAPTPVNKPLVLAVNAPLADSMGLGVKTRENEEFSQVFSGSALYEGMRPFAMCYGGHQFGNWAGQLGDGRAINLGGLKSSGGAVLQLQLKGAGPTPYSRRADGRAVLRSSIREYVCSEAMYYLGVPTTRALSLSLTGERVERDMFYDGRSELEPSAVVCRVSPCFIRFGSFQIWSVRQKPQILMSLLEYTISTQYPELEALYRADPAEAALAMFNKVLQRSIDLVVNWMRVGFVHGVLNTDNMSIIGETIDYGPYGWLDSFDPDWTPNTTDRQHRRYRFSQQPAIVQWNLWQLANALFPVIGDAKALEEVIQSFSAKYDAAWSVMMAKKLGFQSEKNIEAKFFRRLESLLDNLDLDMTLFYRKLSGFAASPGGQVDEMLRGLLEFSYQQSPKNNDVDAFAGWLSEYLRRRGVDSMGGEEAARQMNAVNPAITPRNFILQEIIESAHAGEYEELEGFLRALECPYEENELTQKYMRMRPDWAIEKPGCSTLSCSS